MCVFLRPVDHGQFLVMGSWRLFVSGVHVVAVLGSTSHLILAVGASLVIASGVL